MPRADSSPCVAVGIDGSRTAVQAALWAVDEARARGIPLRLVYAIDPADATPVEDEAHRLATAELTVRQAYTAIEAADPNLEIEIEILHGNPTEVLRRVSRSAALICVGDLGFHHFAARHAGSTAASLALSAHCPVAVIRGDGRHVSGERGCVVVDLGDAIDVGATLQLGVDEALLRRAPLRVLATWDSKHTDLGEGGAPDAGKLVAANLERRLESLRHRHPELEVTAQVEHGGSLDYLARNCHAIQLVVMGGGNGDAVRELLGASGHTALHEAGTSVLVANHRSL